MQTEKEATCTLTIQAAAELETQMVEEEQEKLANAHHPKPSTQKKAMRPRSVKLLVKDPGESKGEKGKISSQFKLFVDHAPRQRIWIPRWDPPR